MATAGGPNIERDGLVFGYDTSYGIDTNNISSRFYSGEPATNLFTVLGTPSNTDQDVTFAVQGTGTFKRVAVGTKIGNYTVKAEDVVYSYALGGTGCHYHGNDYGTISSGTKVSLNIEYFLSGEVSIVANYLGSFEQLSGVAGSWGSVNSETNKWHRVSLTRTATGTGNLRMLMYPGACASSTLSNQGTIYFKNPTVTLTAQPTTFVNGTRSSTQSLIDLTKTTDINVSNVSFDSDGQPTFDGTDDYIQTSLTGINLDSQCSIEGVLQRKSTPTAWRTFFNLKPSGANTPFFEFRSGANSQHIYADYYNGTDYTTNAASFTTGTYGHAVATYDGAGNVKMYFNGELIHTKTGVPSFALGTNSRLTVGRAYDNSRNTDIEAPVVKIYNRALSAQEVQQHYNSYKNRFNI